MTQVSYLNGTYWATVNGRTFSFSDANNIPDDISGTDSIAIVNAVHKINRRERISGRSKAVIVAISIVTAIAILNLFGHIAQSGSKSSAPTCSFSDTGSNSIPSLPPVEKWQTPLESKQFKSLVNLNHTLATELASKNSKEIKPNTTFDFGY